MRLLLEETEEPPLRIKTDTKKIMAANLYTTHGFLQPLYGEVFNGKAYV